MTRKELLRMMPRNAADSESAKKIIAMGYPIIEPVHSDMLRSMGVANSPAADLFADYFAKIGAFAAGTLAKELSRENCWLRYRFLTRVFPFWTDLDLSLMAGILTIMATQPDAYDNDVRCVTLLAERGLADLDWLSGWLEFKKERWSGRWWLLETAVTATSSAKSKIQPQE